MVVAIATLSGRYIVQNPCTLIPPPRTRQKMMTSDTFNDADVVIPRCQISPGCPTAPAVLDGHSRWNQPSSPIPPAPSKRAEFGNTEPPIPSRNPFSALRHGLFVLFQLDKRELARQIPIPEDSELFETFLEVPTKRYVGLVVDDFSQGDDEHFIAFVGKTLPPGSGSSPEPDSYAIPIVQPIKGENVNRRQPLHLNGRRPLEPKRFPWAGCCQYTLFEVKVSPTQIYTSSTEYVLDKTNDTDAFDEFSAHDRETLKDQLRNASSVPDKEALLFKMISDKVVFPVKVWQDLSAEGVCHDPRDFMEEALELNEIAHESKSLGPVSLESSL